MFFESSYYASPHIEDLLKKEDVTLTELLDDDEILQEYKSQNKNLIHYFHRAEIVDQLVTLIITEPPTDLPDAQRFKYPNIACEILTTDVPDMTERLIENQPVLQKLYSFLEQDPPLNPLLTSFFSKTFGMLIIKKSEQNWFAYQCVCLQVLEFIKTRERFLETVFKHVGTPAIMDLLFQVIVNIEGPDLKNNLFNWLKEQNMVPRLINILSCDSDGEKHNNVAQFICDIINHSRSFRQFDLVERGAQRTLDDAGMSLLYALEDVQVMNCLLDIILMKTSKESTIVAGIRIVLKLLEKPVINERDANDAKKMEQIEDNHRSVLLDKLLPLIAHRIKHFHELLLNPPQKTDNIYSDSALSPPFGNTRLQVCILLSVVLRTGHSQIEKAICDTDFFSTLLMLFKQYCWNNLLHNQVKTCIIYALTPRSDESPISALLTHIVVKCKIVTSLVNCWMQNNETVKTSLKRGARLGYMGHLIAIFEVLSNFCEQHSEYRALIESSFDGTEDQRLAAWKSIEGQEDGELQTELKLQNTLLAGMDPYAKNEEDFHNSIITNEEFFAVNNEGTELFEQACKNKELNASNIDDILSDMLNSDDNDLFGLSASRSTTNNDRHNDDDFYYDRDSDDDDFEHNQPYRENEEEYEAEIEDDFDDDDEDHPEKASKRLQALQARLIMASDKNANVHQSEILNGFGTNDANELGSIRPLDQSLWDNKISNKISDLSFDFQNPEFGSTSFFANFPPVSNAVTAVFDPVDPFGVTFSDSANEVPFTFDATADFAAFSTEENSSELKNDCFDAVFEDDSHTKTESLANVSIAANVNDVNIDNAKDVSIAKTNEANINNDGVADMNVNNLSKLSIDNTDTTSLEVVKNGSLLNVPPDTEVTAATHNGTADAEFDAKFDAVFD